MLHLIPAPLHRLALRHGYRLRRLWWRIRRPRISGVCVIARDQYGRVLLVRLSYGTGKWSLPAGGLQAGEDPTAAAAREFAEELGCGLAGICLVEEREEDLFGAQDRVFLFAAQVNGIPQPDRREVLEAAFFAPDALPENLEKRVVRRLQLLEQA